MKGTVHHLASAGKEVKHLQREDEVIGTKQVLQKRRTW